MLNSVSTRVLPPDIYLFLLFEELLIPTTDLRYYFSRYIFSGLLNLKVKMPDIRRTITAECGNVGYIIMHNDKLL